MNLRIIRHSFGTTVCAAFAAVTGCIPAQTYHRPLEPLADRLRATYADLGSGRFQVIADFESLDQGAIFRVSPPTAAAFVGISTEKAKPETGAASLRLRLTSAEQTLVIEDTGQGQWTLPRDWRRFNLLIMSVYSARPVSGLCFAARSGSEKLLEYEQPGLMLNEGWNLLRIDVGDMADRIDVADIREMRLRFAQIDDPVDIYLDDMILVDNAKDMLGSTRGQPGDLYCRTEGRRVRVGVVERFELVFARGRIVQWFDLRHDPDRIRNLAGGGDIGPSPVTLQGNVESRPQIEEDVGWSRLGATAEITQGLAEVTPVRVIVWGHWRFGTQAKDSAPENSQPAHRWIYTVYSTGKVYAQFTGILQPEGSSAGAIGYLVSCAEADGFHRILPSGPSSSTQPAAASYVLYSREQQAQPDLLFTFYRNSVAPKARPARQAEQARLGTLFHGGPTEARTDWAAMLAFWPPEIDGPKQADPMVADYTKPLPITLAAGRLVRTDPGDLDGDGFNESRGHYTVEPDGNVVKIRIDGQRQARFSPAFKVMDVANRNVWAYVDGFELKPVARDADGNAIVQVPRTLDSETLIEVVTREKVADTQPLGRPPTMAPAK